MKKEELLEKLSALIAPIVNGLNYELYNIEYVKEDDEFFLRVYIDNLNGISLEDCEKVSRPISEMLDVNDPITDSYYLEVSSPGINRYLYTDNHLEKYKNFKVHIKLSKALDDKKVLDGLLIDFNDADIIININDIDIHVPRLKIKSINLEGEL